MGWPQTKIVTHVLPNVSKLSNSWWPRPVATNRLVATAGALVATERFQFIFGSLPFLQDHWSDFRCSPACQTHTHSGSFAHGEKLPSFCIHLTIASQMVAARSTLMYLARRGHQLFDNLKAFDIKQHMCDNFGVWPAHLESFGDEAA